MKYCCKKFDKWQELGWLINPKYYEGKWHFNTGSGGEVSYDIPIFYCPFCGKKLKNETPI